MDKIHDLLKDSEITLQSDNTLKYDLHICFLPTIMVLQYNAGV